MKLCVVLGMCGSGESGEKLRCEIEYPPGLRVSVPS